MHLVVDVTMYNGEAVMRHRLRHLAPHVDAFVVVEAAHTHAGAAKGAYFLDTMHDDVFRPYAAKLRTVRVDAFPDFSGDDNASWRREAHQRDAALPALLDIVAAAGADGGAGGAVDAGGDGGGGGGRDVVAVVADVDEVPTAEALAALRTMPLGTDPVHLDMFALYYSPRTMVVPPQWRKAFAVAGAALTPATSLTALRLRDPPTALLPAAGFHLSFFMTPDEARRKIESFAHTEFDRDDVKDRIADRMRAGTDVLGRPGTWLAPTPEAVLRMFPVDLNVFFGDAITHGNAATATTRGDG